MRRLVRETRGMDVEDQEPIAFRRNGHVNSMCHVMIYMPQGP
jgi:hypothetical protein